MHNIVLVLACLACVGETSRAKLPVAEEHAAADEESFLEVRQDSEKASAQGVPVAKLALGLLAFNPTSSAFKPSGPGGLRAARPYQAAGLRPGAALHRPNQRRPILAMSARDDPTQDKKEEDVTTMSLTVPERLKKEVADIRRDVTDVDIFKVFAKVVEPLQYVAEDSVRVRYTLPMLARVGYFLGQGVTLSAAGMSPQGSESDAQATRLNPSSVMGALQDALLADDVEELAQPNAKLAEELADQLGVDDVQRDLFAKNFASIITLLKKDLKNIENGEYKLPYDLDPQVFEAVQPLPMETVFRETFGLLPELPRVLPQKQWNPLSVARQLGAYVKDRQDVLDRMERKDGLEIRNIWKSNMYPKYYLQNFHYQTDGWLSRKSARLYDYQVESLFLGTADAMRRQVMPELNHYIKGLGRSEENIKLLDTATGTGRFASFVLDNNPNLDVTVLDLSPFYLEEARELLQRFPQVDFMQAAVENIDAPDETYDAVTCVYLFHELPLEARRAALKEFFRTLKPGGKLFFVDSAQKGEVPYDRVLKGFTLIAHEPYYINYSEMDLKGMMEEVGFRVESEEVHWVSKSMVAVKPLMSDEEIKNWAELEKDIGDYEETMEWKLENPYEVDVGLTGKDVGLEFQVLPPAT